MKPLIGITSYFLNTKDEKNELLKRYLAPHVYVSYPYYALQIERAGGIPVNIPLFAENASLNALVPRIDGVLFCGGEDIAPDRYGETPKGAENWVQERDEFEFKLFKAFFEAQKPIFGICRGMQLMNVFFKGSLIQDIPSEDRGYLKHSQSDESFSPVHAISTVKGTRLNALLGDDFRVNTLHHQAARQVGEGLDVSAHSEDGLIEAIERPNYPFMMGVQWHPERLSGEEQIVLFKEFIASASR